MKKFRAVLLFGMPGSGKGTQGKSVGVMPGYLHISCGDIFRQTNVLGRRGKEVAKYTSQGMLVPDDLTVDIFRTHLGLLEKQGLFAPARDIMVLDGIPRTYQQAELLGADIDVLHIFNLVIQNEEEAVQRILARASKDHRADDTNEQVVRSRFATFRRETMDTLRFYDPKLVTEIDAAQRALKVHLDLVTQLWDQERRLL